MISICSYCRGIIGEKEPFKDRRSSHGICPVCYDFHMPRILEIDLSEHLDQYESPVIMVDKDGRLIAANRSMEAFLGRPKEEILGLLGGELMGCRYARLAEGCGQTIHCGTCTIRNTVERTRTGNKDLSDIAAFLDQDHQRVHFQISTFNRGAFIRLSIDKLVGTEPLASKSIWC